LEVSFSLLFQLLQDVSQCDTKVSEVQYNVVCYSMLMFTFQFISLNFSN